MQHAGGELAHHHLIAVGFFQCGHHDPGFDRAAVNKEGLQGAAGPGIGGAGHITGDGVLFPMAVDRDHPGTLSAVNAVDSRLQAAGAGGREHLLAIPDEGDGHLRMSKGLQLNGSGHPAALHRVSFHEFHAGRGVEKQIPNDDGGAIGATHLGFFGDLAGLQVEAGAAEIVSGFGHQIDAADGSNGSQGFAAEATGINGGQIICGAELGGGVPQKCGAGILGFHAAAVIGDPQEGHAAVADLHRYFGGTGVYGIFQQFLDHGCGPFHHLTGGDEVGNMGG